VNDGPILPDAVLGILGGGQLGRMTALAARAMGYRVHVLDPDPACAAASVVEQVIAAPFDDARAAATLAKGCSVVTFEIEKIAPASLAAVAERAPLRPSAAVLHVVQDRVRQKRWLAAAGFPVGPFREAGTEEEFVAAVEAFGGRVFAKSSFGGYDGRGQATLDEDVEGAHRHALLAGTEAGTTAPTARRAESARAAWRAVGEGPCVVEEALALEAELSVLVARGVDGTSVAYPPARNHHVDRVLDWSQLPGGFDPPLVTRAQELATGIAAALDVVGLLCVELFLTRDGRLLVNELAPRPHNSHHGSEAACPTGQFEQLVRAVCALPLGAVEPARPSAIVNLLGDLWADGRTPDFAAALAVPGVRLVLYGKGDPRPGRKMGHLVALGDTPDGALARAREARTRLALESRKPFSV
jgi:5-(carboxyamino)imidazole ribonucleotide synthase